MKINPVNKNLLIEPAKAEDITKSGIIVPVSAQELPKYGVVIAIAPDCSQFGRDPKVFGAQGEHIIVGAKVLYKSYAGSTVVIDKEEYLLLPEEDVLAFLTDEEE